MKRIINLPWPNPENYFGCVTAFPELFPRVARGSVAILLLAVWKLRARRYEEANRDPG